MSDQIAVVIPVFRSMPMKNERISLEQCFKVLSRYHIIFVHPVSLDISFYENSFKHLGIIDFHKHSDVYFEGTKGYSKLLTSKFFYEAFDNYEHILIYQLDSFVFRDELEDWSIRGFDYVGAPWISQDIYEWHKKKRSPVELKAFNKLTGGKLMKRTGNGGFSLRKISTIVKNLSMFSFRANSWAINEDLFFSHYLGTFNPFFRIPSVKTALKFSFDSHAKEAFKLNNNELPFGCHGWYRNDSPNYSENYLFWKPHIEEARSNAV